MTYQLYQGDCLDILPTLEAGSIDAVITDPPYGIEGGNGSLSMARGKGNYLSPFSDTPEYINDVVIKAIRHCMKIAVSVIVTPGNKNLMSYPQPNSFGAFYQPAAIGLQTFGNLDAQPILYYGKSATKKIWAFRVHS
jgi:hypothetical protein